MVPDPDLVTARMRELHMGPADVAARMRRAGLHGTSPHWVDATARGVWVSIPEEWLAVLAAALHADPGELAGRPRRFLVLRGGRDG